MRLREVAEAYRAKTGKRRGFPNEMVQTVRAIERLLTKRRKLRKKLRSLERDLKHEKKMLKALAGVEEEEL